MGGFRWYNSNFAGPPFGMVVQSILLTISLIHVFYWFLQQQSDANVGLFDLKTGQFENLKVRLYSASLQNVNRQII